MSSEILDAMVATRSTPISGSMKTTSLMRLVLSTKVVDGQTVSDAVPCPSAVTAKLDKRVSSPKNTTPMVLQNTVQ
jgi:hypothetical protein